MILDCKTKSEHNSFSLITQIFKRPEKPVKHIQEEEKSNKKNSQQKLKTGANPHKQTNALMINRQNKSMVKNPDPSAQQKPNTSILIYQMINNNLLCKIMNFISKLIILTK